MAEMAAKDDTDECNKFWETIQRETGAQIPIYIRNILMFNVFNSALSIRLLDESDLNDIESLVQSGTMKSLLPEDFDFEKIYGPFHKSVDKFTFLRGHRKSLLAIKDHIQEKVAKNIFANTAPKSKNDSASRQAIQSQFNGNNWLALFPAAATDFFRCFLVICRQKILTGG